MSIRNLDKIFKPQAVAVVGASDRQGSVGNTLMENLKQAGFQGKIYPINPKRESIIGIPAYPNLQEIPEIPDLAVVATPARSVPGIIKQCGEKGIMGVIIVSAGFREIGTEGKQLEQEIAAIAAQFDGLRILGPNCLGIIVPGWGLNASFAADTPKAGNIAFISQSGALCTSILDWALERGIGFSHFVSIGNMADIDVSDLIDYFGCDPDTRSMILYLESIHDARRFMSAARAFARTKPIVVYKSGRFSESAKAAASHTGALAGEDAVYDAAFSRAGVVRVLEIDDIFDVAELLARQSPPKGARLAIVTNAGGPGVMATDALIARGGILAKLSDRSVEALNQKLPPFWSHNNPVDILGDASPERFKDALNIVVEDPEVDAVLVILSPQAMTDPSATASILGSVGNHTKKPILAAWMGGRRVKEGLHLLNEAGIPVYTTPEQAVSAFMHLVSYARNLEVLYETPRDIPVAFSLDRLRLRDLFNTLISEYRDILSETLSKALLDAYEIPVTKPYIARSPDEAVDYADFLGYPVVLKVLSAALTHKSDVDGVILNLRDEEEVRVAFDRIIESAKEKRPDAIVDGVTVQRMVEAPHGVELIVGAKKDPTFGAVIMVGMGGTAAEVFKDRALALPPLNERLASRMLESLRSWPLLKGYRGKSGIDIDKLIEVLMRVSYLVADYPEIAELDINPLLVTANTVVALDARIVIDRTTIGRRRRPYQHLAIHPYPEEYVRHIRLADNVSITLRPIRPEDEPAWHYMVNRSSPETIRYRFRYLFKGTTHEMATRYCVIDYDRELAIVVETEEGGDRRLVGICRLISDAEHKIAEYAVFVTDDWQGKGLGGILTDYALEIAKRWGVSQLVVETAIDNNRMLSLLRTREFSIQRDPLDGAVLATKLLTR